MCLSGPCPRDTKERQCGNAECDNQVTAHRLYIFSGLVHRLADGIAHVVRDRRARLEAIGIQGTLLARRIQLLARLGGIAPRGGSAVFSLLDEAPAVGRAARIDERQLSCLHTVHLDPVAVEHGPEQSL